MGTTKPLVVPFAASLAREKNQSIKTEDNTMKYQKPELTFVGDSLELIQGSPKGSGMQDNPGHLPAKYSVAAYEADE